MERASNTACTQLPKKQKSPRPLYPVRMAPLGSVSVETLTVVPGAKAAAGWAGRAIAAGRGVMVAVVGRGTA